MSLQDYITIDDVPNKMFKKFGDTTKQLYVDKANNELEDLAKRTIKGFDLTDIMMPIHFKAKDYLTHYAAQQLAVDNIGIETTSSTDKYLDLFKRESYIIQGLKPEITETVLTGIDEGPITRSIVSQRLVRG